MVTGLVPLSASYSTTLGYDVAFAGTNMMGWWAFDDDGAGVLGDFGFVFNGSSFLFVPVLETGGYYTAPGIFSGFVLGFSLTGFDGVGVLTITETGIPTPAPAALALFGLGAITLALARRR